MVCSERRLKRLSSVCAYGASQLGKIEAIRKRIDALGKPIDLEVDGGVDQSNCRRIIEAGADVLVAGTATFRGGPSAYADNIRALRG